MRSFVPYPLPPADPLVMASAAADFHAATMTALARLSVAGSMVLDPDRFLYGFVHKEAIVTSQIEGTRATLRDVLTFEATHRSEYPDDVREVCNYVEALRGNRAGQYSIRINVQWRICFCWGEDGPYEVEIVDYH